MENNANFYIHQQVNQYNEIVNLLLVTVLNYDCNKRASLTSVKNDVTSYPQASKETGDL